MCGDCAQVGVFSQRTLICQLLEILHFYGNYRL